MEVTKTERGFTLCNFIDRYDQGCSLQKSSLATEDAIWLGVDDVDPQIMRSDAERLGILNQTEETGERGWVKYKIPKEVILSSRMHLTQDMVKELLPVLQKFAETGEL